MSFVSIPTLLHSHRRGTSGPEWLSTRRAMVLAWYFENGYFVNLSLDLNQKIVRRRTVPRHDLNRG